MPFYSQILYLLPTHLEYFTPCIIPTVQDSDKQEANKDADHRKFPQPELQFTISCCKQTLTNINQYPFLLFLVGPKVVLPILKDVECEGTHEKNNNYFSWPDYLVLGLMLVITCSIGTFYGFFGEKQETHSDFLHGGGSMGTFPMAMSLAARYVRTYIPIKQIKSEIQTTGSL